MCFLSVFLTIVGLVFSGCQRELPLYEKQFTTEEQDQLGKQFEEGYKQNFYQGSAQETFLIQEGLQFAPNKPEFWRELGAPTVKRGFAKDTYRLYGEVVRCDAVEWQGWRGYLYLYFYRDYERALADFNATDTLTPNFIDYPQATSVDFMRGICYLQLSRYDEAIRFFEGHIEEEVKSVGEDYIDTEVFLFKAIAEYKKQDLEAALATLNRGLKSSNQKSADLWYWVAKIQAQNQAYQQAGEAIQQAVQYYNMGYFHDRNYVEEFYQTYPSMITELRNDINQKL